ncbi:hypothetical protein BC940DRAFT_267541 [Gongronella butleri]|nr:hypothetical protein BC940DRAFT_267541 [Gongronella butleri]
MEKDYYAILDLPRNATSGDIQTAYMNKALRYYPERHSSQEAETRFNNLCEAYEVLCDKVRRSLFDQYGESKLKDGSWYAKLTVPDKKKDRFSALSLFSSTSTAVAAHDDHAFRPSSPDTVFEAFFAKHKKTRANSMPESHQQLQQVQPSSWQLHQHPSEPEPNQHYAIPVNNHTRTRGSRPVPISTGSNNSHAMPRSATDPSGLQSFSSSPNTSTSGGSTTASEPPNQQQQQHSPHSPQPVRLAVNFASSQPLMATSPPQQQAPPPPLPLHQSSSMVHSPSSLSPTTTSMTASLPQPAPLSDTSSGFYQHQAYVPSSRTINSNIGGGMSATTTSRGHLKQKLSVTLEDLYNRTTCTVTVQRQMRDGSIRPKTLSIHVRPEWKSGTKVKFPGSGHELPDGRVQDLICVIDVAPHPTFTRNGDDLELTLKVPLTEALLGFHRSIPLLDNTALDIQSVATIQPGDQIRVMGRGMPSSKSDRRGDIIVNYTVVLPMELSQAQKYAIANALRE